MRITAQLVDAVAGTHIWAERYDRELRDIFAVQDEITERVAGAIEPKLLKSEGVRATARGTTNLTAWDLVRQGILQFHQITQPTHMRARELFRQAVSWMLSYRKRTCGLAVSMKALLATAGATMLRPTARGSAVLSQGNPDG